MNYLAEFCSPIKVIGEQNRRLRTPIESIYEFYYFSNRAKALNIDEVIELLHRKYGFIDFNVGRNGEFDELATQAVRRFRREWEEWCELTLVEPYPVVNLDIIEKSYDSVIIPTDRKCHYKAAIGERNKWLAENCDMMIVYIKRDYGGAYKCYKYAQELGVPIMNIADNIKNNYGK